MKAERYMQHENGNLTVKELRGILDALPMDVTFVGPDDRILYYNRNQDKIYERSPDLVGRRVQDCHSMSERAGREVTRILRALNSGESSGELRIISTEERKLHVRYLPVYAENGEFLGTLQITQDITKLVA